MMRRRLAGLLALSLGLPLLAGCDNPEPALARGDRLWAEGNYQNALAEYRLALRQGGEGDDEVQLRVAHAYATLGQLERAKEFYGRLLVRSPSYTDQAVYDYLELARPGRERGDRFAVAGGVEAALELRPDLPLGDLALILARYYADLGETRRAVEFYQRALASTPTDSTPTLLYELGQVHVAQGNCGAALGYFLAYRQRAPRGARRGEASWHAGNCAYELAKQAHQSGALTDALERLSLVLELGEPVTVQDQAWFDRGEILYALGRFDEAVEAYGKVLELNRARRGVLAERAQQRLDEIRFGW